jgi:hypothetical protein
VYKIILDNIIDNIKSGEEKSRSTNCLQETGAIENQSRE